MLSNLREAQEDAGYDRWVVQDDSRVSVAQAGRIADTVATMVASLDERVREMLDTGELAGDQERYPEVLRTCAAGDTVVARMRKLHHATDHVLGQIASLAERLAEVDEDARTILESVETPGAKPEIGYVTDDDGARRPESTPGDRGLRFLLQDVVAISASMRQHADDYHERWQRAWTLLDDEQPALDPDVEHYFDEDRDREP